MIIDDTLSLIVADGNGIGGTTLFRGPLPPSPDFAIVVQEYGGRAGDDVFGVESPAIEYPRVQIRVRGVRDDQITPRVRIERIYQDLAKRGAFTVNGTRYMALSPLQPPYQLAQDENGRYIYAVNFEAMKDKSARP